MTREEIKNKLYYVADTIKMNADKYANGEALENEDWVKAAKEFTACLNYLINSHTDFKEVQGFLEKTDSGNPADPFSPQKPRNGSHKDNPESKESRRSLMFGELDIDNHEPRKIKCIRNDKNSGWWGDDKGELTVGEIYELTDIEVYNSYTLVWIKGTKTPFNSVLFAEVEEE